MAKIAAILPKNVMEILRLSGQDKDFMKKQVNKNNFDFNRRDFLRGTSVATVMAMMGGIPIRAQEKKDEAPTETKRGGGPPINCGVIGCGVHGREIITTLGRLPNAPVIGVCDTYPAFLRRAKEGAPKSEGYDDYKKLLDNKEIKAVFIATPTHQHKEIVIAALAAGKHVYCEAPLAHTIEDARAIAKAAKATEKVNFQAGLQYRSEPQRLFMLPFMRSGSAGKYIKARAQWHKKQSWRRTSPNPEREKELNWRLSNAKPARAWSVNWACTRSMSPPGSSIPGQPPSLALATSSTGTTAVTCPIPFKLSLNIPTGSS